MATKATSPRKTVHAGRAPLRWVVWSLLALAGAGGLALAVAATLVLGILPGEVLRAAQAGAHTVQAPPVEAAKPGLVMLPEVAPPQ